jgi:hypothetical protein
MPALPCMAACAAACRIRLSRGLDSPCAMMLVGFCLLLLVLFSLLAFTVSISTCVEYTTPVLHTHTDTQASTQAAARHPEMWPQHAAGTGDGRCTSSSLTHDTMYASSRRQTLQPTSTATLCMPPVYHTGTKEY